MTRPAKPWAAMSAEEKADLVLPMVRGGASLAEIAERVGAPSRGSIGGVVNRARKRGDEAAPPAQSRKATGAAGGAVVRAKARREAAKPSRPEKPAQHLRAGNIARKADSRQFDPGTAAIVVRAQAFQPIPGVEPVPFGTSGCCKWAVDGLRGPGLLWCGAPRIPGRPYCETHLRLAWQPVAARQRASEKAEERAFA